MLGRRNGLAQLARQAEGWPAVLALAARCEELPPPTALFQVPCTPILLRSCFNVRARSFRKISFDSRCSSDTRPGIYCRLSRRRWVQAEPAGARTRLLRRRGNPDASSLVERVSPSKACSNVPDARAQVHEAVDWCTRRQHWARALELVSDSPATISSSRYFANASNPLRGTVDSDSFVVCRAGSTPRHLSRRHRSTLSRPRSRYATG